ncbi:MAG: hypothetical protein JWQ64_2582 [Subtercola sp.]|nr:hypothetical protein [Subtercola sp.]
MTSWTTEQLAQIGTADEVHVTSRRADGTLRPFVTIWGVRVGDWVYIRSAHGADNPWYRRAVASGTGRIRVPGLEVDVEFEAADPDVHEEIDAAYHAKYDHYGPRIVGPVVGPDAADVTLRLIPAG